LAVHRDSDVNLAVELCIESPLQEKCNEFTLRRHFIDENPRISTVYSAAALSTSPSKLVVKDATNKHLLIVLLALFENGPLGFD
jgi:hypothetical protein